MLQRQASAYTEVRKRHRRPTPSLTEDVRGVDLQNQPTVAIFFVRSKDGEDRAFLARFCQQAIHKDWLFGEGECFPSFPFIRAIPNVERMARKRLPYLGFDPSPIQHLLLQKVPVTCYLPLSSGYSPLRLAVWHHMPILPLSIQNLKNEVAGNWKLAARFQQYILGKGGGAVK